jgi:hypothetical protein
MRKETPAEQSHLAWKATSSQPRGFFVTRIVIHMDGGVTALMLASLLLQASLLFLKSVLLLFSLMLLVFPMLPASLLLQAFDGMSSLLLACQQLLVSLLLKGLSREIEINFFTN